MKTTEDRLRELEEGIEFLEGEVRRLQNGEKRFPFRLFRRQKKR